jgi:hypothetical protein
MKKTYGGPTFSFGAYSAPRNIREFFEQGFVVCLEQIMNNSKVIATECVGSDKKVWLKCERLQNAVVMVRYIHDVAHWIQIAGTTYRIFI